jgi:hypothetical protein
LRYTAVQGSYVKNISRDSTDYLYNLQPDFHRFRGHKRLWFVYDAVNPHAIGDYVTKPEWYHRKGFNAPAMVNRHFANLGHKVQQYQRFPYTVVLYELRPTAKARNRVQNLRMEPKAPHPPTADVARRHELQLVHEL